MNVHLVMVGRHAKLTSMSAPAILVVMAPPAWTLSMVTDVLVDLDSAEQPVKLLLLYSLLVIPIHVSTVAGALTWQEDLNASVILAIQGLCVR